MSTSVSVGATVSTAVGAPEELPVAGFVESDTGGTCWEAAVGAEGKGGSGQEALGVKLGGGAVVSCATSARKADTKSLKITNTNIRNTTRKKT